jgi:hypothetical protein
LSSSLLFGLFLLQNAESELERSQMHFFCTSTVGFVDPNFAQVEKQINGFTNAPNIEKVVIGITFILLLGGMN